MATAIPMAMPTYADVVRVLLGVASESNPAAAVVGEVLLLLLLSTGDGAVLVVVVVEVESLDDVVATILVRVTAPLEMNVKGVAEPLSNSTGFAAVVFLEQQSSGSAASVS
jgi:hypothetical protein